MHFRLEVSPLGGEACVACLSVTSVLHTSNAITFGARNFGVEERLCNPWGLYQSFGHMLVPKMDAVDHGHNRMAHWTEVACTRNLWACCSGLQLGQGGCLHCSRLKRGNSLTCCSSGSSLSWYQYKQVHHMRRKVVPESSRWAVVAHKYSLVQTFDQAHFAGRFPYLNLQKRLVLRQNSLGLQDILDLGDSLCLRRRECSDSQVLMYMEYYFHMPWWKEHTEGWQVGTIRQDW